MLGIGTNRVEEWGWCQEEFSPFSFTGSAVYLFIYPFVKMFSEEVIPVRGKEDSGKKFLES